VALAANLGSGFRAPEIFELYASGVHGGVAAIQLGNPTLESERSLSGDLALRLRTGRLSGEITAYYNRIRNYIYLRNTGETGQGGLPIYVNDQTDATLTGVEGFVEASALPWLVLGAGGAWMDTSGDGLDEEEGADGSLPLIPADRLEGMVRFEPAGAGTLVGPFAQLRVRHSFAKSTAGPFEPFSQFDVIPFGTASTGAYTRLDLTLGATLELGRTPLDVTLGVENLADEAFRDFLDTYKGYALNVGRNVILKLGASF
jgi:iron complex outermembrane receptor protein/hemoglobin/transferrin/lactoferrin receptor protein